MRRTMDKCLYVMFLKRWTGTKWKYPKDIDLNDSFVLSWSLGTDELAFEVEASIWPDSKYYDKPKKNEYTCYKPARLLFKYVKEVNGLLEMAQVTPSTDAKSQKDYGISMHYKKIVKVF